MEWIKVVDKMPPMEDENSTVHVFIWVVEDWDGHEHGFADSGRYSRTWGGWLADEGTLESQGFRITHWAEIEPPEGISGN